MARDEVARRKKGTWLKETLWLSKWKELFCSKVDYFHVGQIDRTKTGINQSVYWLFLITDST